VEDGLKGRMPWMGDLCQLPSLVSLVLVLAEEGDSRKPNPVLMSEEKRFFLVLVWVVL
jgi:hypothetical protein